MEEVKLSLRHFVREKMNMIGAFENSEDLHDSLKSLQGLLPASRVKISESALDVEGANDHTLRELFIKHHYHQVLELLVSSFCVEWIKLVVKGKAEQLLRDLFLEGDPSIAFTVLSAAVHTDRLNFRVQRCVLMLEEFIKTGKLTELLWQQCNLGKEAACFSQSVDTDGDPGSRITVDPNTQHTWDSLITCLAALPDRVTAKLGNETSALFYPEGYCQCIADALVSTLERVYSVLSGGATSSVTFLSQLLAKFSLVGYGETLWLLLQPHFIAKSVDNFLWSRIYEKLITRVSDRALESVIVPILKNLPWYGMLDRLLGNTVVTSRKLAHLFTSKLVLLRTFPGDLFLHNLVGYLATSNSRKHLHMSLMKQVLEVWGDRSAVKHTSYEQHKYISKVILVSLAFASQDDLNHIKHDLLNILMGGVQVHLDSPIPEMRKLGMIVAEAITDKLNITEHKLKFEYEEDEEVQNLKSLLEPPSKPDLTETVRKCVQNLELRPEPVGDVAPPEESQDKETIHNSDLDSDDDLEPYDLSNDRRQVSVKAPVYVRDCMEGLLDSNQPDHVETCLTSAAGLIRKHSTTVQEVCVEFCKILLHLEDGGTIPAFLLHRHAALTALGVASPIPVAEYLTKQFYERNYNIRQRLDILEVLAATARELSQPVDSQAPSGGNKRHPALSPSICETEPDVPEDWRQIVQQRIETKTRRFAKGGRTPEPAKSANRFAPVAGHFFFPLMAKFDRPEPCLDLLGGDHLVLSRLLYTLGIIMYAAIHAPIARQMALALFEFTWALQYHTQPSVRRALIYAVSMILLSVPSHILLTDLQTVTIQAKTWLQGLSAKGALVHFTRCASCFHGFI